MAPPTNQRSLGPRLIGVSGNLCRLQRRRLARHHKTWSESTTLALSRSRTNQIASNHHRQVASSFRINQQPNKSDDGELFLQSTVEACASNVAVLNETGTILYVSKPWQLSAENYASQGRSHPLNLKFLERRNGSSARSSVHSSALVEDIQAILEGRVKAFHNEYSCPGPSGTSCFVVHAARLDLPGPGGGFRVLVNSSDITHARQTEEMLRDLGGRLITAQEEERSRVARELHDNLNQRMALLSVELEQLSQKMPASQVNLRSSINNVWERAQEISSEIHRVSYQLHPSKLDHLGLAAAIKSHCLELTSLHEIQIAFQEKACSGLLPKDVTLCLFRIVQESFRNVIKHSCAREAAVTLVGSPNSIHLWISDNGRGFDVDSLESKCGLGLISMRERLRSVGGLLSIHSSAQGTTIEVWVPLNGSDIRSPEIHSGALDSASRNQNIRKGLATTRERKNYHETRANYSGGRS